MISLRTLIARIKHTAKNYPGYFWLLVGATVVLFLSVCLKLSDLIYALMALIILFYTIETYKMRRAIAENTELNTRPILALEIDFKEKKAFIRNFSNFPAYNFRIEDYKFEEIDNSSSEIFKNIHAEEPSPILYEDFGIVDVIPPKDKVLILESNVDDLTKLFFSVFRSLTI
jgi:hypothetical protein